MNSNTLISDFSSEMKTRYLDYAMNVIVDRALPDVRDGLKPVHRRILYDMGIELGLTHDKPYKKSARVVGDVLGKFHPHGDSSVYDALVRMAQDFSLRYPLVDGHGNWGSIDGDNAAAMRYTETRLTHLSDYMLKDIKSNTTDFKPNFDGEELEPVVLPAKFPNLLINGSEGIAVGLTTQIPSHNLKEVINVIMYQIDNPNCNVKDLLQYIKAPDFCTGCDIINPQDMFELYSTGKGKIIMRSSYHIEKQNKKELIVFTTIPYQTKKSKIIESIANLKSNKDKIIKNIVEVRDESDKDGIRIVIELKQNTNKNLILTRLFKKTDLQKNYNAILRALVNKEPNVLNLKELIYHYINFQKDIIYKKSSFDLDKVRKRVHILEGLKIAIDQIDYIIKLIRQSKNSAEAKASLINKLKIDEIQAKAILDLKLQRLTSLDRQDLDVEYEDLLNQSERLNGLINNEKLLLSKLKDDLLQILNKFGDERKSQIIHESEIPEIQEKDFIEDYNCKILYTKQNYIKKLLRTSDEQKLRDGDEILEEIQSTNKSTLLLFTNKSNRYKIPCYELETHKPSTLGGYIPNIIDLEGGEEVIKVISLKDETKANGYVVLVYENGRISKINIQSYISANKKLQNCYSTKSKLIDIFYTEKDVDIFLLSKEGKGLILNTSCFNSKKSKDSQGDIAINLQSKINDNKLINCIVNPNKETKLIINTEKNNIEYCLGNIANTSKEETRTWYNYLSGKNRNKGNYIYNCKIKKDFILSVDTRIQR